MGENDPCTLFSIDIWEYASSFSIGLLCFLGQNIEMLISKHCGFISYLINKYNKWFCVHESSWSNVTRIVKFLRFPYIFYSIRISLHRVSHWKGYWNLKTISIRVQRCQLMLVVKEKSRPTSHFPIWHTRTIRSIGWQSLFGIYIMHTMVIDRKEVHRCDGLTEDKGRSRLSFSLWWLF